MPEEMDQEKFEQERKEIDQVKKTEMVKIK